MSIGNKPVVGDAAPSRTWQSWGASVIGPAHARRGLPNQDSFLIRRWTWGEIAVVSDGLGSRPLSHLGSQAACQAAARAAVLHRRHPQAGLEAMLRFLHGWWLWLVAPNRPDDCAATCLFAVRTDEALILAQIGDGMAVACRHDGRDPVVLAPDKEDGFANVTACLGETHGAGAWRAVRLPGGSVDAVLLCTDGIADDLAPGQAAAFAAGVVESHHALPPDRRRREIRRWLEAWPVPGHSDDKTLACLHAVRRTR